MDKKKKKFIEKLKKQSKSDLVQWITDLYEENFYHKKRIQELTSLVFSHQAVIHHILDHRKIKFIDIIEVDEDEKELELPEKKEDLKSYA